MIVDASAILAVLLREPEEHGFVEALTDLPGKASLSPVNFLEVASRVDRGDMPEVSEQLHTILERMNIEVVEITPEQARLAREAYRRYGRGNHPAKLNLGDCFAYALAKARNEPLLYKGGDFRLTDVEAAV